MPNAPTIRIGEQRQATPALLAKLLNLANDLRRSFAAEPLEELPKSRPQIPQACVIANALNFNCQVLPRRRGVGCVLFEKREHAERFIELTGQDARPWPSGHGEFEAPLTPELNEIARAFDRGDLPELEALVWK